MPVVTKIQEYGNLLKVIYDDETVALAYPTAGGLWIVSESATVGTPTGEIYNPWSAYTISGTWLNHDGYSAGGIDYPLNYGTDVLAPADGTYRISGGSGQLLAGWVGSAGRRTILELNEPFPRVMPRETQPPEGTGALIAIVFQHLSTFGTAGTYSKGDVLCQSGASANGLDYGGDTHLHVHGVDTTGNRVDFLKFIP